MISIKVVEVFFLYKQETKEIYRVSKLEDFNYVVELQGQFVMMDIHELEQFKNRK